MDIQDSLDEFDYWKFSCIIDDISIDITIDYNSCKENVLLCTKIHTFSTKFLYAAFSWKDILDPLQNIRIREECLYIHTRRLEKQLLLYNIRLFYSSYLPWLSLLFSELSQEQML